SEASSVTTALRGGREGDVRGAGGELHESCDSAVDRASQSARLGITLAIVESFGGAGGDDKGVHGRPHRPISELPGQLRGDAVDDLLGVQPGVTNRGGGRIPMNETGREGAGRLRPTLER